MDCICCIQTKMDSGETEKGSEPTGKEPQRQQPFQRAPLQVYRHIRGETLGADRELLTQINKSTGWLPVNRSNKLFIETKDVKECDIILLFCSISSRLGADVMAAMNEVSGYSDKPVILVLMYHTYKADHSTHTENWSERFPVIELQVPVLFHETVGGLLKCDKNLEASNIIQQKLMQWRPKSETCTLQ